MKEFFLKHLHLLLAIVAGGIFFAVYYRMQFLGVNHYDEGIVLYGATKVMAGELPYQDFHFLYPPGFIYVLGEVFKLFGASIAHARMLLFVFHTFSIFLAVYLSSRIGSVWYGVVTAVLLLLFKTTVLALSVPLSLLACLFFSWYISRNDRRYLFLSGVMAGLVSFFRLDFSVYLIAALTLTIMMRKRWGYTDKRMKRLMKGGVGFGSGVLLGMVPMIVFILTVGIDAAVLHLGTYIQQNILYRPLPHPSFLPPLHGIESLPPHEYLIQIGRVWPYAFPYLVAALTLADLYRRRVVLQKKRDVFYLRLLLSLCIIMFSFYTRYRADLPHIQPIYIWVCMLFPAAFEGVYTWLRWLSTRAARIITWGSIAASLVFLIHLHIVEPLGVRGNEFVYLDVPRAGGIHVSKGFDPGYDTLVKYLLEITNPGEYLFVGGTRHDIIFVNDNALNFLTETKSPTRYWWYDPGMQSRKDIQEAMIAQLQQNQPRYVVLWTIASESEEKNKGSISSGVHLLDTYIRDSYTPVKQIGDYIVLKRSW